MSATYFPLGASEHDALASVSEPAEHEGVFVLAMHSPPDNRLSPAYISDCVRSLCPFCLCLLPA